MKALIDGRSYQAALHRGAMARPAHGGRRLNAFLAIAEGVLGEPPQTSDLPLTAARLVGVDLVVILTRRPGPALRFSQKEYQGIEGHLSSGGALLLMTNHAPYDEHDRQLIRKVGAAYGVSVCGGAGRRRQGEMRIDGNDIRRHPITEGVRALHFRSSHILTCRPQAGVSILATIPGRAAPGNVFALTIDGVSRMVLGGDSGFICDESDERDTGYIDHADNRRYTRQLLEWLCRER